MKSLFAAFLMAAAGSFGEAALATFTYQDLLGTSAPEQNLRFARTDAGTAVPEGLTYTTYRVLNAAGVEVPWQPMSNGDLMVRSDVPTSRFPTATPPNFDQINPDGSLRGQYAPCPAIETVVQFVALPGGVLPGGANPTADYFVVACQNTSGASSNWTLATTYNGSPSRFNEIGSKWFLRLKAAKLAGDFIYAAGHSYINGDTLMFDFVDGGAFQSGLSPDSIYFVCNATPDTFQLSLNPTCRSLVTEMSGNGTLQVLSSKRWTLQNVTTSIKGANTPLTAISGKYLEITNGLLGVRIPTQVYQAASQFALAPLQQVQLADGTWTPPAGNISYDWQTNTNAGHTVPVGYSITLVEQGLLEIDAQITITALRSYDFNTGSHGLTADPVSNTLIGTVAINPYAIYVSSSSVAALPIGVYFVLTKTSNGVTVSTTPGGAPIALTSGSVSVVALTQEPGPGYLTTVVRMFANTKAILVEEDHTINQYYWALNFRPNLIADTARWRGSNIPSAFSCGYKALAVTALSLSGTTLTITSSNHGLSTNAPIQLQKTTGIANANGQPFTVTVLDQDHISVKCPTCSGAVGSGGIIESLSNINAGYEDVFVDLLGVNRPSAYVCTPTLLRWVGSQYEPNNQGQTGRYWMWYSSADSSSGNSVGLFLGRGSWQNYGEIYHGPGFFDIPSEDAQGIAVYSAGRGAADNYYTGEMKKSWGIWISTKADVLSSKSFQPIQIVRNSLASINVSKFSRDYTLTYPDPPNGWPYLYESPAGIAELQSLYTDGTPLCGSVNCLSAAVRSSDALQGSTIAYLMSDTSAASSESAIQPLISTMSTWANVLFNQNGNLDPNLHYYQGLYPCSRNSSLANLILKSANSTAWQKARAKAFVAMCGCIAWDGDYFSTDPSVSGGLGNQQSQFLQIKSQLAIQAYTQPFLFTVVPQAISNTVANVFGSISPSGVGYASWHYESAAVEQGVFGLLSLKNYGQFDPAAYPILSRFGQWYISGITPPEVRFGQTRMYFSNGDGNTEPQGMPGLLATLLSNSDPQTSQNLMWTWLSQGVSSANIDGFFAPSIMAIDFSIPTLNPQLKSQHFPGYHSALRSGWGTRFENAVSFLYGGFYSGQGHAHNDTGQVSAYLLGAPVAIDWNPNLYYPEVPGRFAHNSVVLDSELVPRAWSDDSPDLGLVSNWTGASPESTQVTRTLTLTGSSSASASWSKPDGTTWCRQVMLLNYDPSIAVLHVSDAFTGPQASAGKTITWNLMAYGPVNTPAGSVLPIERFFSTGNSDRCGTYANEDCPSSGAVFPLSAGLEKFAFTGQTWTQHATQGVDWSVYFKSDGSQTFLIGSWSHNQQSTASLYNSVNSSSTFKTFREYQDILRVHGNSGFDTTIVGRKKGTADPVVTAEACGTQVVSAGKLCFDQSYSQYDDGAGNQALATYDNSSHTAFGVTISDAPAECRISASSGIICTSGGTARGPSVITLPAAASPKQPTAFDANGNALIYSVSAPSAFEFSNGAQDQGNATLVAPGRVEIQRLTVSQKISPSTPFLLLVRARSRVVVKGPRGTYEAQWSTGTGAGPTFTITLQ